VERLSDTQIEERLASFPNWRREGEAITADYDRGGFSAAIAFLNQVADCAELANHHPDILVHGYRHVRVTLTTHSAAGLTERDFALATKIDAIS
jgi:4a-hydroxytetrahydrobiopterin dehydratase